MVTLPTINCFYCNHSNWSVCMGLRMHDLRSLNPHLHVQYFCLMKITSLDRGSLHEIHMRIFLVAKMGSVIRAFTAVLCRVYFLLFVDSYAVCVLVWFKRHFIHCAHRMHVETAELFSRRLCHSHIHSSCSCLMQLHMDPTIIPFVRVRPSTCLRGETRVCHGDSKFILSADAT